MIVPTLLRGNASTDALRRFSWDAERPGLHSHAERGNDQDFAQEAGEAMTIIGLVAAGLGVSVLPASYQRMRIDGVVYRPLLDPEAVSAVWLVQRKDQKSPMAKAFVELLTSKVEPLTV
ncbi:hypothetical protein BK667_01115 [Pseudomonas frederiksbergensis]|nr:LysR substrate-binding domain-containing protein [Pseudomonas frederiksbergensis]RON58954.1 hypothetical protein BK667_01115 [Pseudomonas frederiksbergensis]